MSSEEVIEYEETAQYDEPVPEWHLKILEERMARYGPHFTEGTSWEEFEEELMTELMEASKKPKS